MQKDKTMSTSLTETPVFNYLQGQWVYGKYDGHCHLRVAQNVNYTEHLANVRCLKPHSDIWWKLEPEIDAASYIESSILGHSEHEPVMDQRGALNKLSNFETFLQAVLQLFL